jgi:hypothetical protein
VGCGEAQPTGKLVATDAADTVSNPWPTRIRHCWRLARLDSGRLRSKLFFPESLQCGTESHHHVSASPNLKITGRYFCSYGNMDCYHANDTHRVAGISISGSRLNVRVIMADW